MDIARNRESFGSLSNAGLYGVISHTVARRRGEIGLRLALGAAGADIVTLVLSRVGIGVLAGTVVGCRCLVVVRREPIGV